MSATELQHASFTPFDTPVDEVLRHKTLMFLRRLAKRLSVGWGKSYGHMFTWIKVHLAFAVTRATNLCLHKSRVRWRSASSIDVASSLMFHWFVVIEILFYLARSQQ